MIAASRTTVIVRGQGLRQPQKGVALAIVVWFIAGMSLLVAGIVSNASVDTRMTQLHVARAKVSAAGDGAVHLLLAELVSGIVPSRVLQSMKARQYRMGELQVEVTLTPVTGLIDLNAAPGEVLVALFVVAAGLGQSEAELLAANVVDWRRPASRQGVENTGASRFREIEDLLRVEGVGRALFDGVRDYVVAGNVSSGGMDWTQAPPQVLSVLQQTNERKFAAVNRRKGRLAQAADAPGRPSGGAGIGGAYRADAVVRYGDRTWVRRRWVLMASSGQSLLPWRVMRTEASRVTGA